MGRALSVGRGCDRARRIGRGGAAAIALSLSVVGSAAAATVPPVAPDVPASNAEPDILRWIAQRTSISRRMILIVEPRAVVALASSISMVGPGSVARAQLREELLGADAKTRSALFAVDLDCTSHKYRIAEREMYPLPDLKGAALTDPEPKPWAAVDESAPIGKAWLAACSPGFVFPYAPQAVAAAPAPTPAPSPAPIKKPPAPRTLTVAGAPPPRATPRPAPAPPPAPAPSPAAAGGPYEAVLGAFAVKANAVAASDKLDRVLAPALAGRRKGLHTATVNGKLFTVLSVSGFASASDAASFCNAARAIKLDCVAKRSAPN